jgi:hypothetical protein
MQTRRGFIQRSLMLLGAIAISGSTMLLTACGNVAQDIVVAFKSLISLLANAGVIPGGSVITAVLAALQSVLDDVTAYQHAPAADKTSFGLRLALAIQIAQAQLQTFWSNLNLTGTLGLVVNGLVSIILSTLEAFLPALPLPAQSDFVRDSMKLPHRISFVPQKRDSKQFRSDWNNLMTQYGYQKTKF